MKTKVLFLLLTFMAFSLNAQTTHHLNWFMGIGSSADLTIESGDTVVWTWTSPNHTVENDPAGTSVETFNSGFLAPNGSTFSHTFTTVGTNDYYCSIHGAAMMSGTITVQSSSTTHHLDWFMGIGSNADLTIESGDTVVWTWTSPNHTVENDPNGSSVETFNSGFLAPNGSTFSHTFTVVGSNDYYCSIHGAAMMSGTITVEPSLSVEDETLASFSIIPNPASSLLHIELSQAITKGDIKIYNLLGKQVVIKSFENTANVKVDISGLTNGLYLVSIESENRIQSKRFIKN